ncbi:MAG TPA: class I SAM-dependent methyltransferase [Thermoanaerobaculia bacterium]|jgi:SAM-dependent methyltransferase|nr:class I SAM-dependent methyltransferase [Thermoanaerobaculia bacterium]
MTVHARAAYDAIAADYDDRVAPSSWVRERLWERLDALFPAGSRVLDVTAGTGLDTLHLLARDVHVTACDLSPGMLAQIVRKAPDLRCRVADVDRLEAAGLEGPFDGLISTFAGLNAASGLSGFARAAARLVRPGGVLFLHVLGRWRKRLRKTLSVRIAGIDVPHRLWSVRELARAFAPGFALSRIAGQGILRPVDDAGKNASLDRWERAVAELPVSRALGTFVSLELIRRG